MTLNAALRCSGKKHLCCSGSREGKIILIQNNLNLFLFIPSYFIPSYSNEMLQSALSFCSTVRVATPIGMFIPFAISQFSARWIFLSRPLSIIPFPLGFSEFFLADVFAFLFSRLSFIFRSEEH